MIIKLIRIRTHSDCELHGREKTITEKKLVSKCLFIYILQLAK